MARTKPGPDLRTVGARLAYVRALRGIEGRTLSAAASLSVAAVHYIENHPTTDVRSGNILALARALACSPAWLAWGYGSVTDPYPGEPPS